MNPSASLKETGADRFAHLARRHPCLSREAHGKTGRLHLPVSPACNIRCRFCTRGLNSTKRLPGNAARLVAPGEAVAVVGRALELCPKLAVVGVAGPGDALASDHAIVALTAVHEAYPLLIKCLSTNGLRLAERVGDLVEAGVETVTVTVNSVEPSTQAHLCKAVFVDSDEAPRRRVIPGEAGARLLIDAQLAGIEAAVRAGIVVKVNTVLVPGVNDSGVEAIAELASDAGASLMNVIPLIPNCAAADLEAPDCDQLRAARAAAERHLPVFRHCRQCRADALGVPGQKEDLARRLFGKASAPWAGDATFSHG